MVAISYNGLCLQHTLRLAFIILWRLFLIMSANVLRLGIRIQINCDFFNILTCYGLATSPFHCIKPPKRLNVFSKPNWFMMPQA